MTTEELKSKTVKKLRRMSPGYNDLLHDCVTGEAADEFARRLEVLQGHFNEVDTALRVSEDEVLRLRNSLEEAQQKIVAQQVRIAERGEVIRQALITGSVEVELASRALSRIDDLSILTAHDAELTAKAKAEALEECRWTPDLYGVWETGCGEVFVLNDGTPKQNGMVFCPYCGKAIRSSETS